MAVDAKTGQPIFRGSTTVGLRNVGSYQVSGQPFITGSENLDAGRVHLIEFDKVAKSFTVINNNANSGEDIRVHFNSGSATELTSSGDSGAQPIENTAKVYAQFHYVTIPAGNGSMTFDSKCSKVYVSNPPGATNNLKYQVFAELTNIPSSRMYHLTGSGISE